MRSQFYYEDVSRQVASRIKPYLNSRRVSLMQDAIGSTRAVGDILQSVLAAQFEALLGDWCGSYSSEFARRAMADMAFTDSQGFYSIIDVKTHREGTQFSRPNLTSVHRLARLYESDTDVFALILIKYSVQDSTIVISDVQFVPIEFLDWRCLAIGALGWGQIQLVDSDDIRVVHRYSRKAWMLQLCDAVLAFYPREIGKIHDRIEFFQSVHTAWEAAEDKWAG